MANSKIDSISIGGTVYDIDLPTDATPTISTLTVASTITIGDTSLVHTHSVIGDTSTPETFVVSANNSNASLTFKDFVGINLFGNTSYPFYAKLDYDNMYTEAYLMLSNTSTFGSILGSANYYGSQSMRTTKLYASTVHAYEGITGDGDLRLAGDIITGGSLSIAASISAPYLYATSASITSIKGVTGSFTTSVNAPSFYGTTIATNYLKANSASSIIISASTNFSSPMSIFASVYTTDSIYTTGSIRTTSTISADSITTRELYASDALLTFSVIFGSSGDDRIIPFLYHNGSETIKVGQMDSNWTEQKSGHTDLGYSSITTQSYYAAWTTSTTSSTTTSTARALQWVLKGTTIAASAAVSLSSYCTFAAVQSTLPNLLLIVPYNSYSYFYGSITINTTTSFAAPLLVKRTGAGAFRTSTGSLIYYVGRCMVFELI